MYSLTESQFYVEAEPILRNIFVKDDPFGRTFSTKISGRIIIYPCQDEIERPLIDAIIAAAANLGDTGCYMWAIYPKLTNFCHCYVPLSEFLEGYAGPVDSKQLIGYKLDMNPYFLDGFIYSAQGKWGIRKSHEQYGLLGGPPEFIEEIRKTVPDLDDQVYGFLERLKQFKALSPQAMTLNWLPALLGHIYGSEAAEKMLQETGLP
ncbi:MAG: hypothetical protein KME26_31625 [Oscillatoria princeps RMCB-10]|jgi:hypothetical protein|nr:hypothetical protein [Oscillatoria princeps RMCB-10]